MGEVGGGGGVLFNKVPSLTTRRPLTVLERDSSTNFLKGNFVKFLRKLFYRKPPSDHFSYDGFFPVLKIATYGQAL